MANSKPKKAVAKKSSASSKAKAKKSTAPAKKKVTKNVAEKKVGAEVKTKKVEAVKVKEVPFKKDAKEPGFFKTLFAKKCDKSENILTIFKGKKIWGAIIAEVFGTMLLSIVLLTLGVYQPLYMFFVFVGLTLLTFGLSGANLNPIITVGMMASRRMSAIRGVLYIIAQILGAWLGFLIVKAFVVGAGQDPAEVLPKMAAIEGEGDAFLSAFWMVTMIEFVGSLIIGLTFARALQFKRSALTFAMFVAGGVVVAFLFAIIVSSNFASLSDNFLLNPAIALMYQILPTSGAEVSDVLGKIAIALGAHVAFPILGSVVGFCISDIASVFNGEKLDV